MLVFTLDLFAEDFDASTTADHAPWIQHDCMFDADFWPDVVNKIWQSTAGDVRSLSAHLVVVPDASMYMPFQAAWAAHAQSLQGPCIMPRMMTLLDWAKSAGASDIDMQYTERVLNWMTQLRDTPQLAEWLGATEDVHLFAVARSLIDMSDELSMHLLAGRDIDDGEAALNAAVDHVFEMNAGVFARQELAVLLQCWRADVNVSSPILKYLQTLQQLIQQAPVPTVWLVRNKPWTQLEAWFWRAYAKAARVELLDIQAVRARVDSNQLEQMRRAWSEAARIVEPSMVIETSHFDIRQAEHLEDEAQAIARQVFEWRQDPLIKKIALVALDRQVSRRVWALLARLGVTIRDDTGWLLATSRAASSWRTGLALWQGEVLAVELLEWMSHPMVLADWPASHKRLLMRHMHAVALAQKPLARTWQAWLNLISRQSVDEVLQIEAEALQIDVRQAAIDLLGRALNIQAAWRRTFNLPQWAANIHQWAEHFGLFNAWQKDPAGQIWLRLLEKWRGASEPSSKVQLDLSTFMRIADSEVEATTFRPHDVTDDVLLLPIGSTRMRYFDAVWLMGADSTNLPNAKQDRGLLNMAVRMQLGLPTHLDQHAQTKADLIDLLATTPRAVASYCTQKDGAPNAISTWLAQWLRAGHATTVKPITLPLETITSDVHMRSQVNIAQHVPVEISASELSQLTACPYQYYAHQVLYVSSMELPSDDISAADKGNAWHKIIATFHKKRALPHESHEQSDAQDAVLLTQLIHDQLKPLCAQNARYWAVHELFLGYVDAYLVWWYDREADGWHVEHSESWQPHAYEITLKNEIKPLLWKGKIDQIDGREHPDPVTGEIQYERAIIDYKTGKLSTYITNIKNDDDVQLAFYVNLFDDNDRAQITQAGYVGVSSEPSKPLNKEKPHAGNSSYPQAWLNPSMTAPDNAALQTAATQLHARVDGLFKRMHAGEELQAMGELTACAWCEVRGLCRKGYVQTSKQN
ncbi:ATP-dependent helicase/deoxyribonuclease subunit B [Ephemeroptericola cinctiostellae]|uniref:ATP-dependent helicase/deoxyribonuclease subunit B n=1 Tax=Ephemeroptericola cinctiostellae TaxID=2268024 RepID=A0A345DBS6_9BURK|nr:PD-(D/E)XK nuclease family protein [Ephemeroptericola cinctiostellae]AXF85814.1 ATP-dependent helicase/deoxyribonuclease subunit B [Ephemeroptericola cinctiostellae]